MKEKLYNMATITAPIIAFYGACPLYIFKILDASNTFLIFLGLTVSIFFNWVILIQLKLRYPNLNNYILFAISYAMNILLRLIIIAITSPFNFKPPQAVDQYFAYPIVTSFAINTIVLIILDSMIKTDKYIQTERELQELKFQNSEAQKLVLMQQLQPHFLFNALSNLKSLIKDNAQAAEDYTVKLSEFLHYSVASHQSQKVTLKEELDFTMDYIDLQKVRFGNAFKYEIDIPESAMNYEMPVLALQNLVENIFKHNFFTEKNPMHFTITFKSEALEVWNKKKSVKITNRSSTGLSNLQKRYELIMQKQITIADTEDSFSVTLPLLVL
jgi:two-component system, LytTR family, sensor kinase